MGNSSSSSSFSNSKRYNGGSSSGGANNKGKRVRSSSSDRFASGPPPAPGKPYLVVASPADEPDVITVKWKPPSTRGHGASEITGYIVEHRRTNSPHWVKAVPGQIEKHFLTLSGLEPGCRYQFRVKSVNYCGSSPPSAVSDPVTMTVHRTAVVAPVFVCGIEDRVALENDQVKFEVEFEGTPAPKISWYKDGFELFSNRRQRVNTDNGVSTLYIHQAEYADEGEIKCSATNKAGHAITKARLRLEAPPMVRLPQDYEEGLLLEQNEPMRLKVSVSGRPLPQVTWFHDGEEIRGGDRFEVIHTDKYAALKLASVKRSDRGCYQIQAVNPLGEHTASFLVTVTDRPSPPGKVHVSKTSGKSVALSWKAPEDDGGCKIGSYIIEYNRVGWDMWLKASTSRLLTADLDDLLEGSEYRFRVKAENPYGISIPSDVSDPIFLPDIKRGIYKPTNATSLLFEDDEKLIKNEETKMLKYFGRKSKSPEPSSKPRKLSVDEVSPPVPKRRKKRTKTDLNKSETDIYKSESYLDASSEIWHQPIEQKDHWGLPPGLKANSGRTSPKNPLNSQDAKLLDYKTKGNSTDSLLILNFERGSAPPISLSSPELGAESEGFEEHIRNSYSSSELLYERNLNRFNGYSNDEASSAEAQKIAIYAMDRKNSLRRSPITRRSNDGSEEKSVFSDSDSVQSVVEVSSGKKASSFLSLANSIEEEVEEATATIAAADDDDDDDDYEGPSTSYDGPESEASEGSGIESDESAAEFMNFGSGKRALDHSSSGAFFSTAYCDDDYLSDQRLSDRERSTSPAVRAGAAAAAAAAAEEKSDEMSQDSLNSSASSGEYSRPDAAAESPAAVEPDRQTAYRPRDGIPKFVMLPNPFYKENAETSPSSPVPDDRRVKFELSSNYDEIVPPEIPKRDEGGGGGGGGHLALPVITVTEMADHRSSPKSVLKKIFVPAFAGHDRSYYDEYNNANSSTFSTFNKRSPDRDERSPDRRDYAATDEKSPDRRDYVANEERSPDRDYAAVASGASTPSQEDAAMVVVKHYGDILERYSGVAKRTSSKTYLDFEQLKQAAIECEPAAIVFDDRDGSDDDDDDDRPYREDLDEYDERPQPEEAADADDRPRADFEGEQQVEGADDRRLAVVVMDAPTANTVPYLKIVGNVSLALFGYWLYTYKDEKLSVPIFGFLFFRLFKTQVWDRI